MQGQRKNVKGRDSRLILKKRKKRLNPPKIAQSAVFDNFCPAFKGRSERSERFPRHLLKSGWGLGGKAPTQILFMRLSFPENA